MTSYFDRLPVELIEGILDQLTYSELARTRNVCRAFRTLCTSTAIAQERKKLLELHHVIRSDASTALIRAKLAPFFNDFNRAEYLGRIADALPKEFATWILETPTSDVIGWHWPGLQGEHNRDRYTELGLDFIEAMIFSRHLKPGYTLLPSANVMEVEDPDYSEFNETNFHFYPGSWHCQRSVRENKVRALQVWADMSGLAPKITLLILSGSERWDGFVWETESRAPFRHSPESITASTSVQLIWRKQMGTWTDYLKAECQTLQEKYRSFASVKMYRIGRGGHVYVSPTQS